MAIKFTQYLRPNSRKKDVTIDRPPDIEAQASRLVAAGARLEVEELTTGMVSLTCEREDESGEVDVMSMKIVPNGPAVLAAVDSLINAAAAKL